MADGTHQPRRGCVGTILGVEASTLNRDGAMDITQSISTVKGFATYTVADPQAWSQIECPNCRKPQMLSVAKREYPELLSGGELNPGGDAINNWLLCVVCGTAAVSDSYRRLSPPSMEYPTPDGTPQAETKMWEEVRGCLSIEAYNAVAMLCRKLLLHLVFTHERSRNPQAMPRNITFAKAVRYLLDNGVITAAYDPLVSEIKNIGNRANHELPDITGGEARKIAYFTHHLFVSVYEVPKKASIPTAFVGAAAEPYDGDFEPDVSSESS